MYIPLATKYRPQKFLDVVGQDITVKIITKAIIKNRVGHAILFSGTRGVGKTTLARILAKALRCENRQDSDYEPCCRCESCLSFSKDNQIDVIEIDAASNTGVDDIREIIESCRYKPSIGQYKIFIIDEVHMLSKSAFNALLKTLEEPPIHVKFLLATTETYKIPETILSRVLKLDLKNVDNDTIAQYLSTICNQENISANADVLKAIAVAANGSIRDSLSILDQAINIAENNKLTTNDITELLGIADDYSMLELFDLILSANLNKAIEKYREIVQRKTFPNMIITRLMDFVHLASCIKSNVKSPLNILDDNLYDSLKKIIDKTNLAVLSRIWQMLLKGVEELKFTDRPELVLEMLIIRITYSSDFPDLQDIVKKLDSECFEKDKNYDIRENCEGNKNSLLDSALKMFPDAKIQ